MTGNVSCKAIKIRDKKSNRDLNLSLFILFDLYKSNKKKDILNYERRLEKLAERKITVVFFVALTSGRRKSI
ncbi:hypothetical protein TH63_18315 [Rufibacter radiotolerans]|uniref:Uncharacterized protein n=1 Tax=Rufibacter radiotolerans TaxID=1379910 RepID=A0A0H4VPC5_9BACT|nr:hypothetical protein TH63_18315 [Rufibacter radiotolerans]